MAVVIVCVARRPDDLSDGPDSKVLRKAASATAFMTSTPQHGGPPGVHRTISPEGITCFQVYHTYTYINIQ